MDRTVEVWVPKGSAINGDCRWRIVKVWSLGAGRVDVVYEFGKTDSVPVADMVRIFGKVEGVMSSTAGSGTEQWHRNKTEEEGRKILDETRKRAAKAGFVCIGHWAEDSRGYHPIPT